MQMKSKNMQISNCKRTNSWSARPHQRAYMQSTTLRVPEDNSKYLYILIFSWHSYADDDKKIKGKEYAMKDIEKLTLAVPG